MRNITSYRCELFLLFLGIMLFGEISVNAAESSGDHEFKAFVGLFPSFPEQMEMAEYCQELLNEFGQRYSSLATCLVSNARPVRLCQNCYKDFNNLREIYANISDEVGPGNVSCRDVLLHADRLMLLNNLNRSLEDIWLSSKCVNCLTEGQKDVSNATLYFIELLNQSRTCFEKYQQGNGSELCTQCRPSYKMLNDLYSNMLANSTVCIDVEDAMNVTRRLWSNMYNCLLKREENVPVIAVSGFMLFLPVIFYLSNYLHSEQKKRKLMHPKRAKSSHNLMNIQDKYS